MQAITVTPEQTIGGRECGMMTSCAIQGGGKTYQNMHLIAKYVRDKLDTKVPARKFLIFDTNGEYTTEEFSKNGIPNFTARTLKLSDVRAWCRDPKVIECRRIDAKDLSIAEKKKALEYIIANVKNCGLGLEDINTYILSVTHMEEIVGRIVKLRHIGVDVLMSYQSARAIEPRIYQNSRWFRMHYISENVNEIKGKVGNFTIYKIAQIIVNKNFEDGDERYFIYITHFGRKIEGPKLKLAEWEEACRRYLLLYKKETTEHALLNSCTEDESRTRLVAQFTRIYYNNPDKPKQIKKIENGKQNPK